VQLDILVKKVILELQAQPEIQEQRVQRAQPVKKVILV
jgi:hypothetical protein